MKKNRADKTRYDFKSDYSNWYNYACQFHKRNMGAKKDIYISSQSIVEKSSHLAIVEAKADRSSVLEIGGGGGEHIEYEEKHNDLENYHVIDLEEPFIAILKKQYPVHALVADAIEMPYKDSFFSTCISTSMLEHVDGLGKLLCEIKRVLIPGGDFLITVPTNGSFILNTYKRFISYPFMKRNGVTRPDYIWHYLNINSFNRILAMVNVHFHVVDEYAVPFKFLPVNLSPMYFFHCKNNKK